MANLKVIQGCSTVCDLLSVTGITDYSSANWTGRAYLSLTLGGTKIIDRALEKSADNTGFLAYLRPSETLALSTAVDYALTYELTNTAINPQINLQDQHTLRVTPKP